MKLRPMTKQEEEANSNNGPLLEEDKYYAATVTKVDFFRNKEGKIVGGKPSQVRDGKCPHPNGQMRLAVWMHLDEFNDDTVVSMPFPWDEEKAPPWNGPKDENGFPIFTKNENGKLIPSGEHNLFTDEDVLRYMKPLRTSGTMPNKIVVIASDFGWSPFIIENGEPVPQELDLEVLLKGKRVYTGRIKNVKTKNFDNEIKPFTMQKKPIQQWVGEMLTNLEGQVMNSGKPFTLENVCVALQINTNVITPNDYTKIASALESSLTNRDLLVPSEFTGGVSEIKLGGL
jgi:hypothetical protein